MNQQGREHVFENDKKRVLALRTRKLNRNKVRKQPLVTNDYSKEKKQTKKNKQNKNKTKNKTNKKKQETLRPPSQSVR